MIILNGKVVPVAKFPAGEIRINVESLEVNEIEVKFEGSDDILALQMVCDAIRQQGKEPDRLIMRYCPYGRQDRVCNEGEAFSLEVMAKTINSLKFNSVVLQDPHSWQQVTMIDNSTVISQVDTWLDLVLEKFNKHKERGQNFTLVSPDKGAKLKIESLTRASGIPAIYCDKVREQSTGKLSGFAVLGEQELSGVYCIVDDICDKGGTFIGLAKELRRLGANKIILCCTHSIFSGGIDIILEHIDEVYTTDSLPYPSNYKNDKLKVITNTWEGNY